MRIPLFLFALCIIVNRAYSQNDNVQIQSAIQAAPEYLRDEATVFGYDENGELIQLRDGQNELICIADDPNKEGFNSVCYHKDLEPFMARGRELRKQGVADEEIFKIREKEATSGKLKMPNQPSTLHVLYGKEGRYDSSSGKVIGVNLRYVVYIPFATAESTGLPIRPMVPGGPWIMDPGTHRAHIMITPPQE